MKNKAPENTAKISSLKNFTSLSRKQLQVITGEENPTLSRSIKKSIGV